MFPSGWWKGLAFIAGIGLAALACIAVIGLLMESA